MTDLRKALAQGGQGCAECGVKASEGYALYCVKCTELFTQPEQEKESAFCDADPRLLLGRRNNFTKETENRLCDTERRLAVIETQQAPPSKPWVSLTYHDITSAAHYEAKYPVSILETTDSGLCLQFSENGEWHSSDKRGDFMKINSFLMSYARAIEAKLKEKNT